MSCLLLRFPGFLAETAVIFSAVAFLWCYRASKRFVPHSAKCGGAHASAARDQLLLLRRPVGRFVLALERQLPRHAAIRQHGPNVPRAGARGFENEVPSIRRPAGPLVAPFVA